MILVKPSFQIWKIDDVAFLADAGRVCYKSEYKIENLQPSEAIVENRKLLKNLVMRGHESVIEHAGATVKIICDRGVTHEIVRHRLCSYSQESTRYCNYSGGVAFVIPPWCDDIVPGEYKHASNFWKPVPWERLNYATQTWASSMFDAEEAYQTLIKTYNWTPQQARSVLPNSLKTEIVMTANYREWRHILKLRTSKAAHPQMREVMLAILDSFKKRLPILFADIVYDE